MRINAERQDCRKGKRMEADRSGVPNGLNNIWPWDIRDLIEKNKSKSEYAVIDVSDCFGWSKLTSCLLECSTLTLRSR